MAKNGPNAGGVWRPLKACSYPGKVQIYSWCCWCPVQIKPWSTVINQFEASRVTYGCKRAIFGNFWPLWRPMAPPKGLSVPMKKPKHIVPDVPWPDETLIKFNQPVWSLPGELWHQKVIFAIFGHFRPLWRPGVSIPHYYKKIGPFYKKNQFLATFIKKFSSGPKDKGQCILFNLHTNVFHH